MCFHMLFGIAKRKLTKSICSNKKIGKRTIVQIHSRSFPFGDTPYKLIHERDDVARRCLPFQPLAASISVASRLLSDGCQAPEARCRSMTVVSDTFVFRVFYQKWESCSKVCARPGSLPRVGGRMGLLRPYGRPFTLVRPTWAIFRSCYSSQWTNTTNRKSFPRVMSRSQSFSIQID